MANIMPISELIEDPVKLSTLCHSKNEPVFLTKDGYGDMVVMSIDTYENLKAQAQAYVELKVLALNKPESVKNPEEKENAEDEKQKAESSLRIGIQKLPLEDVYDILKEEIQQQKNKFKGKRFP